MDGLEEAFLTCASLLAIPPLSQTSSQPQHYAREMDGLEAFLTYADNNAVGYFAKQQFTKTVTLEKEKVGAVVPWRRGAGGGRRGKHSCPL